MVWLLIVSRDEHDHFCSVDLWEVSDLESIIPALIGGLYTVTFVYCTGCTLCRLPDISHHHAAAGSKHACTWRELVKLSTWYRRMLSSPLLDAHITSGPWRNSCTEFTPHGLTLVMSVIRIIKVPFLLPLTDKNKRVWLGGSLFQLALCSSIDASDGGLSMRNSPVSLRGRLALCWMRAPFAPD